MIEGSRPATLARSACRICGANALELLLDLGEQPLANAFLHASDVGGPESRYPLEFCRCSACGHAQLSVTVPPDLMFREYPYVSGTSSTIPKHFAAYARNVAERFVAHGGLVVEIGSNDGTLLHAFEQGAVRVLGVEPARNIAAIANAAGVETWPEFFDETLARRIAKQRGAADAIIANNVLAHIDDLHGLARGLITLLAPAGVFTAEFPYLPDLLERVEYDTIYHEHLSYFSVRAIADLFRRFELTVFEAHRVAVHGGSLRIHVGRRRPVDRSVHELLELEERSGLHGPKPFHGFAQRARAQRDELRALLGRVRLEGRIAAYGAAAKGNTLLNYCGIDATVLDFVVDRSPLKQGLYTPGTHVPVREPEALVRDRPAYTLLLAWNFADEVLEQQRPYRDLGGRFIHPIPVPRVLD